MNKSGRRKEWHWGVLLALLAASFSPLVSMAQEDPEYRMEVGAALGGVTYLGDYNGSLTKDVQPLGALVAKYRPNPRMAWRFAISYGHLKGSSDGTGTWYPDLSPETVEPRRAAPVSFSHQLMDFGLRYEYNFLPYGTGSEYRGARRLTPFIALGAGVTYVKADDAVVAANIPLGLGIKYKIGTRTNLTAEWAMHFATSDKLDGVSDPYGIKSSGLFKNTDGYSVLSVSLTYDIWAKCKTCNNDRD